MTTILNNLRTALLFLAPIVFVSGALSPLCAQSCAKELPRNGENWSAYNGSPNGDHYSPLTQINRGNVKNLKVAWSFDGSEDGGLETNPLVINGILYAYTASQKVIALDAATGKLLWKFDSGIKTKQPARGLAWWNSGNESRLLAGVANFLYALDPATGRPIPSFAHNGRIDLREGLRGDPRLQSIDLTSPGVIYKDLIIVGGRNPETHPSPPGDIRAFDVRTGALRWSFHTIPHPGEPGYETWPPDAWKTAGAANNWTGMALDEARGIVYVPTGSPVFDFYGADRVGDDLYADTLLALDANTGKLLWHFQGVHHDVWDRDFPSPPALYSVQHDGACIDAIAQTTKQGYLFLLDRTTGKPLFPVEERPFPSSEVPGEVTSRTQPVPSVPAPFTRQMLTSDMLTNRTPAAHDWAEKEFNTYRSGGQFFPIALHQETVVFPCFLGGAEWGGPAIDPRHDILFVNANEAACVLALTENKPAASTGERVYHNQCSICHGNDRSGTPPTYPSLIGISDRLSTQQIEDKIAHGGGRMPSFPNLEGDHLKSLIDFLHTPPLSTATKRAGSKDIDQGAIYSSAADGTTLPYEVTGSKDFNDPDGYPAIAPPWGTLSAIDLKSGRYLWKIPFGEYPELAAKGMKTTGSENYGGPVATASGLLFIGATVYDKKIRAYDTANGKLLWESVLPYAGNATPATYMVGHKQYVVIASGGGRVPKGGSGSAYVAFALP